MFSRLLIALLAAASFVTAQDGPCPYLRAVRVPQSIETGPLMPCAGADFTLGELQIGSGQGLCPLFATVTPAHDRAEPSPKRTKVIQVGEVDVTLLRFECRRTHILFFIPDGWYCKHLGSSTIAKYPLLQEVPCNS